ncbi:hypothetical protein F2Q69_00006689 [Brassica cretica]|uniref:Uncharacterized protein n=1 Tax=Brassica cretica TaxID=69181 RepID=A0A8S9P2T2_BRACR|nr:hypothetical protein F2Q69_00006689 [Brassica cretica]
MFLDIPDSFRALMRAFKSDFLIVSSRLALGVAYPDVDAIVLPTPRLLVPKGQGFQEQGKEMKNSKNRNRVFDFAEVIRVSRALLL